MPGEPGFAKPTRRKPASQDGEDGEEGDGEPGSDQTVDRRRR